MTRNTGESVACVARQRRPRVLALSCQSTNGQSWDPFHRCAAKNNSTDDFGEWCASALQCARNEETAIVVRGEGERKFQLLHQGERESGRRLSLPLWYRVFSLHEAMMNARAASGLLVSPSRSRYSYFLLS